jgi:hypothetical protein
LAYQRAQAEWPYVGVVNFWFFKPASDADANQAYYYFRMVEPDFSTLPVYESIKTYAQEQPRMYPGTHQEDHWAITWTGEWSEQAGATATLGASRLAIQDAQARVCIEGSRLQIVPAPDSDPDARYTLEKDAGNCYTLSADPGFAVDGFLVSRSSQPRALGVLVFVGAVALGWMGRRIWKTRQRFAL